MPRKFKPPNLNEKNRECQRQSRARRKELIEDLSREVARYRSQGVAATVEMQHAARAISLENQRLRALLAWHGVSQAEVDQALASPQPLQRPAVSGDGDDASERSNKPPPPLKPPSTTATPTSRRSPHEPASPDVSSLPTYPAAAAAASWQVTRQRHMHNLRSQPAQRSACHDAPPQESDRFLSQEPPTMATKNDGQETSCDAAAAILIQIPGQRDPERTRAALGCVGETSCSVKNTTIFRLMDELN